MKDEYFDKVFREYGFFIFVFERICNDIRISIREVCFPELNLTNANISEILLSGLTAEPLKDKLLSVYIERFHNRKVEYELLNQILNHFSRIISIRNNIVHGLTYVGWNNQNGEIEYDKIQLSHSKLNKYGLDKNFKVIELSSLKSIIENMLLLENCFSYFISLCHSDKRYNNRETLISRIKEYLAEIKIEFEPIVKSIQEHKHIITKK